MPVKNTLTDLNDHLFAQMERLNDEALEGDALEAEIQRSRAVCDVAEQIIENASTVIRVVKMRGEMGAAANVPRMLSGGGD